MLLFNNSPVGTVAAAAAAAADAAAAALLYYAGAPGEAANSGQTL